MAEVTPASIIYGLPKMAWRGLEAPPYDVAGFEISHAQAERRFPFIDGAAHDWVGRDPIPLKFTLYFLNTLRRRAFPFLWEDWRKALLNGAPGEMQHPLLGPLDVVPMRSSIDLKAQTTSGVIVTVEFSETVLDLEAGSKFDGLTVNAKDVAEAADTGMLALGITYPDGMSYSSLKDMIDAILSTPNLYTTWGLGVVTQAQGFVTSIIHSVEALGSSIASPTLSLLRTLWVALEDISAKAGANARPTGAVSYPFDTTFDAVAATVAGNSVTDLLGLNVGLARSPVIPANTAVRFYK